MNAHRLLRNPVIIAMMASMVAGCSSTVSPSRTDIATPTSTSASQTPRTPLGTIAEYALPAADNGAVSIAAGLDGGMWFTIDDSPAAIARVDATGVVTNRYPLPASVGYARNITRGRDDALWFIADSWPPRIGRISATGATNQFPLPKAGNPIDLALGPDGAFWFTSGNGIGRMTTAGAVTFFPVPADIRPYMIASAHDALWITDLLGTKVARMTLDGKITEFSIATGFSPQGIAVAPDGSAWVTTRDTQRRNFTIDRISATGAIIAYPITNHDEPHAIVLGPDGGLWFLQLGHIGRITTAGVITEYDYSGLLSAPQEIAAGPGNTLWFTEDNTNRIGKIAAG